MVDLVILINVLVLVNLAILLNIVTLEILVFDSGESNVLVNRGILADMVVLLILLILVNLRICDESGDSGTNYQYGEFVNCVYSWDSGEW